MASTIARCCPLCFTKRLTQHDGSFRCVKCDEYFEQDEILEIPMMADGMPDYYGAVRSCDCGRNELVEMRDGCPAEIPQCGCCNRPYLYGRNPCNCCTKITSTKCDDKSTCEKHKNK